MEPMQTEEGVLEDSPRTSAARVLVGEGRYFVVNPAASKPERNWRAERYAAVAEHVARTTGWRIVLTGGAGPAEKALTDALKKQDEYHKMLRETQAANVRQAAVDQALKKVDEKEKAVEAATRSKKAAANAELVKAKTELADALKVNSSVTELE